MEAEQILHQLSLRLWGHMVPIIYSIICIYVDSKNKAQSSKVKLILLLFKNRPATGTLTACTHSDEDY